MTSLEICFDRARGKGCTSTKESHDAPLIDQVNDDASRW
jgi:hypothetical protein